MSSYICVLNCAPADSKIFPAAANLYRSSAYDYADEEDTGDRYRAPDAPVAIAGIIHHQHRQDVEQQQDDSLADYYREMELPIGVQGRLLSLARMGLVAIPRNEIGTGSNQGTSTDDMTDGDHIMDTLMNLNGAACAIMV